MTFSQAVMFGQRQWLQVAGDLEGNNQLSTVCSAWHSVNTQYILAILTF